MKYISLSKCNLKNIVILTFILCGFLSLIYIIFDKNFLKDIKNTITKKDIFLIILFSIIIILNRILQIYAFKISPQIGYSHLIINMNIIFTLIASYFLFQQKINIKSLIGIIITLIGLTITICYSN
jgi:drug/metabolite transporter (DMT)-like permease